MSRAPAAGRCAPLLIASLVAASAAGAQLAAPTRLRIDSVFTRFNRTDAPGCALAISERGREVYARGYGMSDLQHRVAIGPSSIFHVASVSKQFTAYAVALLASDGRLSLDDDIRKYVPEVPAYGQRITIRHLMHHTSGLRDQWQLLGLAGWRDHDVITEDDVMRIVARQEGVNFRPGDEYLYSNTGFTLLAVIVKRVSGRSLREFAQARIFEPLGMRDTHFHDDHTMIVPGRTSAYEPRDGGGWKVSIPMFDTYGATSLFSTPSDLLKWMAFLDAPSPREAAVVAAAQTSGMLNGGTAAGYGYGLSIGTHRTLRTVGHSGADAGYRAYVERIPERGLAFAVLCNASNSAPNVLSRRVADILLGESVPPARVPFDTVPQAMPIEWKRQWVGTYRDTVSDAVLRVVLRGDTLALSDGRVLVPTSDTTARIAQGATQLVSGRSAGQVTTVSITPGTTRPLRFRRETTFAPDRAALAAYAGTYYSRELDVTYALSVTDSGLVITQRKLGTLPLAPAFADAFTIEGITVRFTRDRARSPDGFTVTDPRIRGVRFVRVK